MRLTTLIGIFGLRNIWANTYDENRAKMNLINPKYVLRNWMAQLAIDDAEKEDYAKIELLTNLLKDPYGENHDFEKDWFRRRPSGLLTDRDARCYLVRVEH